MRREVLAEAAIAIGFACFFFLAPVVYSRTVITIKPHWYIGTPDYESPSCVIFRIGVGYWSTSPNGGVYFHWSCPPAWPANYPGCDCSVITRTMTTNSTTYTTTFTAYHS